MSAGWMRSKRKSKSKKLEDSRGKPAACEHCGSTSHWFSVMASGSIWCDDCLEYYGWEHLAATKAATTNDGGVTGSMRKAAKQNANRYLARWEVSGSPISLSPPDKEDW